LSKPAHDVSNGLGHLAQAFTAEFAQSLSEIVPAEPGSIQAMTVDRPNFPATTAQKRVGSAQREKAEALGAAPFCRSPEQEIVRTKMQKFIEGVVRSVFKQTLRVETEHYSRHDFTGNTCHEATVIPGQMLSG
jgi:hypothetical protein